MLAEYAVALADLVEAEGRALRRGLALLGWAFMLIAVAGALLLCGLALWIWALYLFIVLWLPPVLAAALTGGFVLLAAGVIAWMVMRTVL